MLLSLTHKRRCLQHRNYHRFLLQLGFLLFVSLVPSQEHLHIMIRRKFLWYHLNWHDAGFQLQQLFFVSGSGAKELGSAKMKEPCGLSSSFDLTVFNPLPATGFWPAGKFSIAAPVLCVFFIGVAPSTSMVWYLKSVPFLLKVIFLGEEPRIGAYTRGVVVTANAFALLTPLLSYTSV